MGLQSDVKGNSSRVRKFFLNEFSGEASVGWSFYNSSWSGPGKDSEKGEHRYVIVFLAHVI